MPLLDEMAAEQYAQKLCKPGKTSQLFFLSDACFTSKIIKNQYVVYMAQCLLFVNDIKPIWALNQEI